MMRMLWTTLWMVWTTLWMVWMGAALGCGGEPPPGAAARLEAPPPGEAVCELPAACAARRSCAWCGLPGDRGAAMRREGACWVTDHTTTAEGAAEWWAFCPLLTGDAAPPAP
jgi:hypothetical protein